MGIKSRLIKLRNQSIEHDMATELEMRPQRQQNWFIDNFFRRGLAYLVGFTEALDARLVKVTAAGAIKVVSVGGGFTDYVVNSGVGANAYAAGQTHEFPVFYSRWDILIEMFGAVVSFRKEDGTWGDDISLPVGTYTEDIVARGIRVRNRIAFQNTEYEVVSLR